MAEFSLGQQLPNVLMGLGEIAGGIGQIQSGGRLPNVASQMRQAYDQRLQQDVENKMRQKAFEMQIEKMDMDKAKEAFDIFDKLDSTGALQTMPEEGRKIFGEYFAKQFKDPAMGKVIESIASDSSQIERLRSYGPKLVEAMGGERQAFQLMKKDPEKFNKVLKSFESGDAAREIDKLVKAGEIDPSKGAKGVKPEFRPLLAKLEDEHKLKLRELHPGLNIDTKGEAEARVKNDEMIEQRVLDRADREYDRSERRKDRDEDRQIRIEHEKRMASQFQQTLAVMQQSRDRIPAAEAKDLDNLKIAYNLTDKMQQLHAEAVKDKGTFTAAFKGALIQSQKGQRFSNIVMKDGFSEAEKKLAAHFNTVYGSLYTLTPERALSEADATRNLTSFMLNNAPDQVQANLQSRKDQYNTALQIKVEGLTGQRRNTAGYNTGPDRSEGGAAPAARPAPPTNVPAVGSIVKGYKFKGGNPADPKSWEKQ